MVMGPVVLATKNRRAGKGQEQSVSSETDQSECKVSCEMVAN
jgi:hypothetical protein